MPENLTETARAITSFRQLAKESFRHGKPDEGMFALREIVRLLADNNPANSALYRDSLCDLMWASLDHGRPNDALSAFETLRADIREPFAELDASLDRLEYELLDACQQRGYSWLAQRVSQMRVDRLRAAGPARQGELAISLDELGQALMREQKFPEAIAAFKDALHIFRAEGEDTTDYGICCSYIARAHLQSNQFEMAVEWGRKSLATASAASGAASVPAGKANDELAIAVSFLARQNASTELAREAIELSDRAYRIFADGCAPTDPALARSLSNRARLEKVIAEGLPHWTSSSLAKVDEVASLPTRLFISHRYHDKASVERLKAILPPHVEPIVFPAILESPQKAISDKLISGVLGADAMICVQSEASERSFWTLFERDLAARNRKHMFVFNVADNSITRYRPQVPKLLVADMFAPEDAGDVERLRRYFVGERSFEFLHGPGLAGDGDVPTLWKMPPNERQNILRNVGLNQGIHLLFLSKKAVRTKWLLDHALSFATFWPKQIVVCWLERPSYPGRAWKQLVASLPSANVYDFSNRPSSSRFSTRDRDGLMVRLYSAFYPILPNQH